MSFAFEDDGARLRWPVEKGWCSWNGLWGGALMGVALAALEKRAARPVLSFHAQFFANAGGDGALTAEVDLPVAGRAVAQGSVSVLREDALILKAGAVLGSLPAGATSVRPPSAPAPESCPLRQWLKPVAGGLDENMETRIASKDGEVLLWVRCPNYAHAPLSSGLIAVAADNPAYAVSLLLGSGSYGVTLDSGLHFLASGEDLPGDSWMLVAIGFDLMSETFAYATADIWAGDRHLAICTQTLRIRRPK